MNWIRLAQDRNHCRVLVKMVKKLLVLFIDQLSDYQVLKNDSAPCT
jgi:hypothetical protein